MTVEATGRKDAEDPGWVVFTREFGEPIDDVWAAVTEPDRLERWIGTWTGDPTAGEVQFVMTAEGEDVPAERCRIEECRPPALLRLTIGEEWELRLSLRERGGRTVLDFAQRVSDPEVAASVGPGWDYYLDRLAAAEGGRPVDTVDWDDYYPALSDHYRSLLAAKSSQSAGSSSDRERPAT